MSSCFGVKGVEDVDGVDGVELGGGKSVLVPHATSE